jgi:hypothetical protein
MAIFGISRPDDDRVVDVDSVEQVQRTISSGKPGRYYIDEISADPLPSGHASRRWGVAIKHRDGTVSLDPDPWPES